MKKLLMFSIFLFALMLSMQGVSSAQNLYFCEGVSSSGQPDNPSSTFNIPSGGGYLYFLVKLPYEVGCYSVDYVIYKIDSKGKAKYYQTVNQDGMETTWTWFWKKYTFYDEGYYRIDVVDCGSTTLVSNYVTINYQ